MKRIISFCKAHKWLLCGAVMSLLPLLCCLIACAAQGYSIGDVYLPASEWNDELFYYKQVEGMINYGIPQGFFGFNESRALHFSFAAWSPVLFFPYIFLGKIFGWNLLSPIFYNIFFLMLAVFGFVLTARPSRRQLFVLTVLFACFTPYTRYMLSGMPECACFCLLILYYGLASGYLLREKKRNYLAGMILLSVIMTWMRPYLILFLLLPLFLLIRDSKKKGISALASVSLFFFAAAGYGLLKYYFSAPYFTPLFKVDWLKKFTEEGLIAGCRNVLATLYYAGRAFFARVLEAFRSGMAEGAIFAAFIAMLLLFAGYSIACLMRKKKEEFLLYAHAALSFLGMFVALLLMYKMKEGSKHLLTFLAAGVFLIALMKTAYYKKAAFTAALFVYLFLYKARDPYDYQIPFRTPEAVERQQYWENVCSEKVSLVKEQTPSYENVVIWVFSDEKDAEQVLSRWQILYELPEGFGISCCYADYVKENLPQLKSRYLMTNSGGEIDALCSTEGFTELGRTQETVLYKRP